MAGDPVLPVAYWLLLAESGSTAALIGRLRHPSIITVQEAFCFKEKDGNEATINGPALLKLPPVPFLLSCQEGEPHMAEPGYETSSEESLGTEEPTAADPKSLKQKQSRRGGRRRGRRGRRRCPDSFATYFPRVLRHIHDGLSLSQEAVSVMDSFVKDIFERITSEASHLVRTTKRSTITSREIQTAVRLLLPGEIGKHAVSEATKAVIRFNRCK
uniref:histone H2B-like n=1 Tax=Halichoerus grypus TaxID=9711 RepID=UPI001659901F|nr:histone H2B-like [Halichoerus grypus]